MVDQAVKPPSKLADTGACLSLMAEGDFLGAHDVCEGLVEKGAGQGDAARSTAFASLVHCAKANSRAPTTSHSSIVWTTM